jgi:uncharacterized damage-inducible protein DinB
MRLRTEFMSDITDHARSMLAYNSWANEKILSAAAGQSADAFTKVGSTLAHAVGTQLFWHSNWTGSESVEPAQDLPLREIRQLFELSNADLENFGQKLTDDEWNRREAWWKRFGFDTKAPLGVTLFQVIYHGIQHRAEVAGLLTEDGCSPGDLDYLVFLRETVTAP